MTPEMARTENVSSSHAVRGRRFDLLMRLQYAGAVLLLGVVVATGFIAIRMDVMLTGVMAQEGENDNAYMSIVRLDEVLTMSALMGAATGDPQWEKRYNDNAPLLDAAIETARNLYAHDGGNEAVRIINAANADLVGFEQKAFALGREGRSAEALSLLKSAAYLDKKKEYAGGIQRLTDAFHRRTNDNFSGARTQAQIMIFLLIAGATGLAIKVVALWQTRKVLNYLSNARAFSQSIMDAIPDPIFVHDAAYVVQRGNRAFNDILRLDPQILPPTVRARESQAMATGLPQEGEESFSLPDGRMMIAVTSISPLILPDGEPGVVGILHDVTDLKRTERELAAHKDNLEEMVSEQTAIIAREREELKAAKNAAETASIAKSEFLANMSHELRTPLNSIIGLAQLLQETPLTEDQRDMLSTVNESSGTLLDIVNDILDISKIESGNLELEHVTFDVCKAVTRVVNMIAPSASKKGLEINFHFRGGDMRVKGDPVRFMRIITNLVGNAMKYTHDGGVDVFLMSAAGPGGTLRADIDVKDTGIGIPKDKLDKVFEKFTQADTSTTRKYGGSGLGLAITRHLVELMKGRIWVKSELGAGSTFSVSIPFPPAGSDEEEVEIGGDYALQEGTIPAAEVRVLVAEDHALNQTYIRRLLPALGIPHFTIVDNGLSARDAALSGDYDLVMMDCHMPQMNGYDSTRAIRAGEEGTARHIPIVAMTANAMMGEREKCIACGMDDYVSKPVNRDRFVQALSRWVQFGPPRATPAAVQNPPVSAVVENTADSAVVENTTDLATLSHVADFATLDLETIRSYSEGDPEMEREFAQIFYTESTRHIAALRGHCVDGVSQEWKEKAHLLKGGAATMGAMAMRALCADAQEGLDATADWRRDMADKIQDAFTAACLELKKLDLLRDGGEEG